MSKKSIPVYFTYTIKGEMQAHLGVEGKFLAQGNPFIYCGTPLDVGSYWGSPFDLKEDINEMTRTLYNLCEECYQEFLVRRALFVLSGSELA